MLNEILLVIFITFIPGLEVRASIPYGILLGGLPWWLVFLVAFGSDIVLAVISYFIFAKAIHLINKIKLIGNLYERAVVRTQKKISPYVEKYGKWGLAAFIAIPLPGSGDITGALAANLLGMRFKSFLMSAIVGTAGASITVTAIVMTGVGLSSIFVSV